MATGYTHPVVAGEVTELADFVLSCARAFGACIQQRDEAPNAPIRLPERSTTYNDREIDRLRQELAEVEAWSLEAADRAEAAERGRLYRQREESADRYAQENAALQAMIAKVEAWNPPTEDHENLKAFMLEQLRSSLWELSDWPVPDRVPAAQFKAERMERLHRNLANAIRRQHEETERIEGARQWIIDLAHSVGRDVVDGAVS